MPIEREDVQSTAYRFWYDTAASVQCRSAHWSAEDTALGLIAFGNSEGEARGHLARKVDDLIANLCAEGVDALHAYFEQRKIKHFLAPTTVDIHPELDDNDDVTSIEDLQARYGVA